MKPADRYERTELGSIRVKDNPPVITEDLMIATVYDKTKKDTKLDLRIYLKTEIDKPWKGLTQQGFRLTRDQYRQLKKLIPVIDKALEIEEEFDLIEQLEELGDPFINKILDKGWQPELDDIWTRYLDNLEDYSSAEELIEKFKDMLDTPQKIFDYLGKDRLHNEANIYLTNEVEVE